MTRPDGPSDGASADEPRPDAHSELSGSAGDVVQARDVHGGVHFHGPAQHDQHGVPQQLPTDARGFVNRHAELEQLDQVLADEPATRVLVIAGTAGVGKTSIALRWAHRTRASFPDGQLYADLRGYDLLAPLEPEQVLDRFLRALGVPPAALPRDIEGMAALYRSLVADRRMLILLDNAATAAQVRPLLPATAGCLAVVTSRGRLSGLTIREGARRLTLNVLAEADAVSLLRTLTAEHRPPDSPEELAELALLCADLPLALRIAAERAASRPRMPLRELIQDLRDESSLWEALSAEDDGTSDGVRSVFAWSYRALPAEAARLFRLLGLHPGPEFSELAAAALSGLPPRRAHRLLDTLVGAHLVEQTAPDRYRFHDLLRAYANGQAHCDETPDECRQARLRVLGWYLHMADAAQARITPEERRVALVPLKTGVTPTVFHGHDDAMRWYEAEWENLVAATRVAATAGLRRLAWQLAVVLRALFMGQNQFRGWIATSQLGLAAARQDNDQHAEAELLESLGMAYTQSGQHERAVHAYEAALRLRQQVADQVGEALTLNGLGLAHLRRRRLAAARVAFERCAAIFRDRQDEYWQAVIAVNLAEVLHSLDERPAAAHLVQRAIGLFRQRHDRRAEGNALRLLSAIYLVDGDASGALDCARQAVETALDLGLVPAEGYWLISLGDAQRAAGDANAALTSYHRAAALQRRIGDHAREAAAWDGAGQALQALGRVEEAIDFHRRAASVFHGAGEQWREALSLSHLAAALADAGRSDEAAERRQDAAQLLRAFDDPHAARLRDRLESQAT